MSPPQVPLSKKFQGLWYAGLGSSAGIPNLGTAGSALNATNSGLQKVDGPGIWFPPINAQTGNVMPLSSLIAAEINNSSEITIEFEILVDTTKLTGGSSRVLTGSWIIQFASATGSNFNFGVRNAAGNWVYTTGASPPGGPSGRFKCSILRLQQLLYVEKWVNGEWVRFGSSVPGVTWDGTFFQTTSSLTIGGQSNNLEFSCGILRYFKTHIDGVYINKYSFDETHLNNPAATTVNTITVNRSAAGPVTTIVPAGKTVYINPDETNSSNYIDITDNSVFDVNNEWGGFEFSGAAGNYLRVPDAAPLDITGDIEIVTRVSAGDWSPAGQQAFVSKSASYGLGVNLGGPTVIVAVFYFTDAPATPIFGASSAVPFVDGTSYWVKMTRVQATGVTSFFYAADSETEPTSWTAAGTPVVGATKTIVSGTDLLTLGALNNAGAWQLVGSIKRGIVRNGIGGSVVFDTGGADVPTNLNATSYTCTTGQTVTINRTDGEPLSILPKSGFNFTGSTGNLVTVPDSLELDISGDLELVFRVSLADWTPISANYIVSKWGNSANRAYNLVVTSSGTLRLSASPDGNASIVANSSAAVPFSDGEAGWVKVVRAASTGIVQFFTSVDMTNEPVSWTKLGADIVSVPGNIFNSNAVLSLGDDTGSGGPDPLKGTIMRAIVRNGIGINTVFDTGGDDIPTNKDATSYVCRTGQTVTITRAGSGTKIVPRTGEDAVLIYSGQVGNTTAGYPWVWGPHGSGGEFRFIRVPQINPGQLFSGLTSATPPYNLYPTSDTLGSQHRPLVGIAIWDKSSYTFKHFRVDTSGQYSSTIADTTGLGTFKPATIRAGLNMPGTVSALGFYKGVGIAPTDEEALDWAQQFLALSNEEYFAAADTSPNPTFESRYQFYQPDTSRDRAAFMAPMESEDINLSQGQVSQDIAILFQKYDILVDKKNSYLAALTQTGFDDYQATPEILATYALRVKQIRNTLTVLKKVLNA